MASRVRSFLELVMVSWHWTCGCLTTLFPVVCASHCTIMSMFAPWKLTWISSGPAALLVFDWLSTLVLAAPFTRAGSAGDSAATDAGTPASGLTAGAGLVAAGGVVGDRDGVA